MLREILARLTKNERGKNRSLNLFSSVNEFVARVKAVGKQMVKEGKLTRLEAMGEGEGSCSAEAVPLMEGCGAMASQSKVLTDTSLLLIDDDDVQVCVSAGYYASIADG